MSPHSVFHSGMGILNKLKTWLQLQAIALYMYDMYIIPYFLGYQPPHYFQVGVFNGINLIPSKWILGNRQ